MIWLKGLNGAPLPWLLEAAFELLEDYMGI